MDETDEKNETLLGTKYDRALRDAVNEKGSNCSESDTPELWWTISERAPYYEALCKGCKSWSECKQAGAKNSNAVGVYAGKLLRRERDESLLDIEGNYVGRGGMTDGRSDPA